MSENLPQHLKKYIAKQNYEKYTSIDQAVWRFILRQLKNYLKTHAHSSYLEGLEKTGIEVEKIPRIEDISNKLQAFGWRALPVSGFIPPAAFMEMQSLGILPIASDIRTLEHLLYTPAPDIVHEAAGHAPILINPEFASYLKEYAQVARKAILSKEDLDLYEAIRILSDIKEHPESTPEEIQKAQDHLDLTSKKMTHTSEGGELSRMNWWTAEYGLIGDLDHPKIYGAGLLSSVGESKLCLSSKVKKIPLSIDCLNQSYDITEPQPQLFVANDFNHLTLVLREMASKMAFTVGGKVGLQKAITAQTVNTVVFESGIQMSGVVADFLENKAGIYYLRFSGPCQISYSDCELPGHDKAYHQHGFGTPIGNLKNSNKNLSGFTEDDLKKCGLIIGNLVKLEFESGVILFGKFKSRIRKDNKLVLLTFADCRVQDGDKILFDPSWGDFDMTVGSEIVSVFGGPADRKSYGETEDFVALQVPTKKYSDSEIKRQSFYSKLREFREKKNFLNSDLQSLFENHQNSFSHDWLFTIEVLELAHVIKFTALQTQALSVLDRLKNELPQDASTIEDGICLATKIEF